MSETKKKEHLNTRTMKNKVFILMFLNQKIITLL